MVVAAAAVVVVVVTEVVMIVVVVAVAIVVAMAAAVAIVVVAAAVLNIHVNHGGYNDAQGTEWNGTGRNGTDGMRRKICERRNAGWKL
jgi:hypothetical protein